MSLAGWLAGIGGVAKGVDQQHMEDDRKALDDKRMAVQQMIAQINAGSRETVAGTNADARRYTADQNRQNTTDRITNTRITADNAERGRTTRATMRNDTTQRGQDLTEGRFWGGDLPLRYDQLETGDATRRFGINTAASTAARGQNMTASTAARGQDLAHGDREGALDVARNNTRARNALGVLALKGKQKPNLFGTAAPAEDWASEFDRLYNEGAGPDDVVDPETPSAPLPSTPGNVAPPAAAAAAPVAAAAPKPTPFAPPPAAAAKPPQGVQPGARVTLRDGRKVTVIKVNPDGTIVFQ